MVFPMYQGNVLSLNPNISATLSPDNAPPPFWTECLTALGNKRPLAPSSGDFVEGWISMQMCKIFWHTSTPWKGNHTNKHELIYMYIYIWCGCVFFAHDMFLDTLRPRKNGHHFADDIFKCIFVNKNLRIFIWILLKCVPKGLINNKSVSI